jgi:predicted phage terminase large subunit-like protein
LYIHCDTTHTAKTTSDYFCLVVLGQNKKDKMYYVLDFVLEKIDPEKQAKELIHYFLKHQRKVKKITFDEKSNNGFGYWVRKLAREEYNLSLPLEELRFNNDKVNHFTPHYNHFKAKRVLLPRNHPRISLAVDQLLAFPNKGSHDDFVDGISGVLDNFAVEDSDMDKYFEMINNVL